MTPEQRRRSARPSRLSGRASRAGALFFSVAGLRAALTLAESEVKETLLL